MDKYSARNKGELVKKGLRLYKGDPETIDEFFPRAGHTVIIRTLVHSFVKKLRESGNQKEATVNVGELINSITLDGSESGELESALRQGPTEVDGTGRAEDLRGAEKSEG